MLLRSGGNVHPARREGVLGQWRDRVYAIALPRLEEGAAQLQLHFGDNERRAA